MGTWAFWVRGVRTRCRNDSRWLCVRALASTLKAKEMICEVMKMSLSADARTLCPFTRTWEVPASVGLNGSLGEGADAELNWPTPGTISPDFSPSLSIPSCQEVFPTHRESGLSENSVGFHGGPPLSSQSGCSFTQMFSPHGT